MSNKRGHSTAILDSDITGPSIPKAFGLHERAQGNNMGILPSLTKGGIKAMSVNLLLEDPSAPVVWRGPVIAGAVQQFWKDVLWGDVDFMFIDMPPGTGDVALTVFQSIPLDGIIIVTTPQDLVTMIVEKAVNMAKLMEIPVLGLVENMSYLECPDCGKKMEIFGKSHVEETALAFGIPNIARMPIDPAVASIIDAGDADNLNCTALNGIMDALEQL
ncbi:MAG: Mrp/NBP35 family ATP-binding protein [Clostridia bacterium]|nr:Mrp/NBP35 family ATP-binding protein [Clostridia bacterium]